jgi:hypothetical protein
MGERLSPVEDPLARADRYRNVAAEYFDLATAALSPFLRGFYRRIAEDYLSRAEVELRAAEGNSHSHVATTERGRA